MSQANEKQIARNLIARFGERRRETIKWLSEIEGLIESQGHQDDLELAEGILREELQHLATLVCVGLERLNMPESRKALAEHMHVLDANDKPVYHYEANIMVAVSPLLIRLEHFIEAAHLVADTKEELYEKGELERLRELLKDTAALVHVWEQHPGNEHDIQKVMHEYLKVVFPDFVAKPTIPGGLKHFNPDGGIRSLRAAIEFKYADSAQELKTSVSGVFEDMAGYSGSRDWERFFSVFYLTHPFEKRRSIIAEFRRPEVKSWTPIVVVGTGSRRRRKSPKA